MRELSLAKRFTSPVQNLTACEHRSVSKDGRIICKKIVQGNCEVSPNICRACPFRAINCAHLRFSLRQVTPSPLIVRFNGRTEVWDDDPPEIHLERAACAAKVVPIEHPRSCKGCSLRQPLQESAKRIPRAAPRTAARGKVVPFPDRSVAAAAG
jgi:hypothetical protein